MTAPKTEKAWAVFRPDGHLWFCTIKETRKDAIACCLYFLVEDWKQAYNKGYRCRKIEIRVKK